MPRWSRLVNGVQTTLLFPPKVNHLFHVPSVMPSVSRCLKNRQKHLTARRVQDGEECTGSHEVPSAGARNNPFLMPKVPKLASAEQVLTMTTF